eukprot:CAMPEP_0168314568 /NCGR_PEP_ID=MMETSP0210-20121227/9003_1 /TAXON_ID=40633 /ORGANISM="Condylostoma magnum, Strain COL2" /LENGTH=39 /DNA_ID= /DNA_START= /DNA_END= /DNA_ORIENTATION=
MKYPLKEEEVKEEVKEDENKKVEDFSARFIKNDSIAELI